MSISILNGNSRMNFVFAVISLIFNTSDAALPVDWIDIPQADCKEILAIQESEIEPLNRLIERYHSIEKSSLECLPKRIELLVAISDYLEQLAMREQFSDQRSTILFFNNTVQGKRKYLEKLLEIPSDEAIAFYHLDYSPLLETRFEPLALRNNSTYSLKMKEFWGRFWLESIDPCHRRLANYYQFWLDTKPPVGDYQSFFLWLESQPIPKNIPVVDYYSDAQLDACRVEIVNGYLRKSNTHELVNTDPAKRNLFIINLSKELYLEAFKDGVWHTSLSRGKPVLGAGLLQIEQGLLKTIAIESGHYLPSLEQGFQSIQILREKGVCFQEPFEIVYFENRNKYKIVISGKDIAQYLDFNKAIHQSQRELVSSNEF